MISFPKLTAALTLSIASQVFTFLAVIAGASIPYELVITAICLSLCYPVILGILAVKKGRSAIVWSCLSILGGPLGPVITYILILCVKAVPPDRTIDQEAWISPADTSTKTAALRQVEPSQLQNSESPPGQL